MKNLLLFVSVFSLAVGCGKEHPPMVVSDVVVHVPKFAHASDSAESKPAIAEKPYRLPGKYQFAIRVVNASAFPNWVPVPNARIRSERGLIGVTGSDGVVVFDMPARSHATVPTSTQWHDSLIVRKTNFHDGGGAINADGGRLIYVALIRRKRR